MRFRRKKSDDPGPDATVPDPEPTAAFQPGTIPATHDQSGAVAGPEFDMRSVGIQPDPAAQQTTDGAVAGQPPGQPDLAPRHTDINSVGVAILPGVPLPGWVSPAPAPVARYPSDPSYRQPASLPSDESVPSASGTWSPIPSTPRPAVASSGAALPPPDPAHWSEHPAGPVVWGAPGGAAAPDLVGSPSAPAPAPVPPAPAPPVTADMSALPPPTGPPLLSDARESTADAAPSVDAPPPAEPAAPGQSAGHEATAATASGTAPLPHRAAGAEEFSWLLQPDTPAAPAAAPDTRLTDVASVIAPEADEPMVGAHPTGADQADVRIPAAAPAEPPADAERADALPGGDLQSAAPPTGHAFAVAPPAPPEAPARVAPATIPWFDPTAVVDLAPAEPTDSSAPTVTGSAAPPDTAPPVAADGDPVNSSASEAAPTAPPPAEPAEPADPPVSAPPPPDLSAAPSIGADGPGTTAGQDEPAATESRGGALKWILIIGGVLVALALAAFAAFVTPGFLNSATQVEPVPVVATPAAVAGLSTVKPAQPATGVYKKMAADLGLSADSQYATYAGEGVTATVWVATAAGATPETLAKAYAAAGGTNIGALSQVPAGPRGGSVACSAASPEQTVCFWTGDGVEGSADVTGLGRSGAAELVAKMRIGLEPQP